jgi:hypothetical protein
VSLSRCASTRASASPSRCFSLVISSRVDILYLQTRVWIDQDRAREYADSDIKYEPGICDTLVTTPLPKALTWRDVPALQAADFFAWEFRKNHENVSEWFDFIDKPDDWDERWDHFEQWSLQKFGSKTPTTRKSAVSLLEGNELYAMIWDYKNLCEAHEVRGGVWA